MMFLDRFLKVPESLVEAMGDGFGHVHLVIDLLGERIKLFREVDQLGSEVLTNLGEGR